MCGIAGIAAPDLDAEELEHRAARMAAAIRHRGPDAEGIRVFADAERPDGVALAHRRLGPDSSLGGDGTGDGAAPGRHLRVRDPGPRRAPPLPRPRSRRHEAAV